MIESRRRPDRRRSRRISWSVPVRCGTGGEVRRGCTVDLSRHGARLYLEASPPLARPLRVVLELAPWYRLHAVGNPVWSRRIGNGWEVGVSLRISGWLAERRFHDGLEARPSPSALFPQLHRGGSVLGGPSRGAGNPLHAAA